MVSKFQLCILSFRHKACVWQIDEHNPQDRASIAASRGKNQLLLSASLLLLTSRNISTHDYHRFRDICNGQNFDFFPLDCCITINIIESILRQCFTENISATRSWITLTDVYMYFQTISFVSDWCRMHRSYRSGYDVCHVVTVQLM